MKSFTAAALVAAALITLPAPAFADEMAGPHAPLTCTVAGAHEKSNATATLDDKTVSLRCEPSSMLMPHAMRMKMIGRVAAKTRAFGPNIDGLATPQAIDEAWAKWNNNLFRMSVPAP